MKHATWTAVAALALGTIGFTGCDTDDTRTETDTPTNDARTAGDRTAPGAGTGTITEPGMPGDTPGATGAPVAPGGANNTDAARLNPPTTAPTTNPSGRSGSTGGSGAGGTGGTGTSGGIGGGAGGAGGTGGAGGASGAGGAGMPR